MNLTHKKIWLWIAVGLLVGLLAISGISGMLMYFSGSRENSLNRMVNGFMARFPGVRIEIRKLVRVTDLAYVGWKFSNSQLPIYEIVIDANDLLFLNGNLPREGTKLTDEYKKSVKATFMADGIAYKVKVRYRGDNPNHWGYEKKSWRITFDEATPFHGWKAINLILPEDRHFVLEAWGDQVAKNFGLTFPDTGFVGLKVNKKNMGVYFMTEHFTKDFLERHGWSSDTNLYSDEPEDPTTMNIYADANNFQQMVQATYEPVKSRSDIEQLIETLNKPFTPEAVYELKQRVDMDNFLAWNAHSVLTFSRSQRFTHNIMLHYEKDSGRFQFIPWSTLMADEDPADTPVDSYFNPIMGRLLSDPDILHARNKVLWSYVSDNEQVDADLEYYDNNLNLIKPGVYTDPVKLFSNLEFDSRTKVFRERMVKAYKKVQERLLESKATFAIIDIPNGVAVDLYSSGFSSVYFDSLQVSVSGNVKPKVYVDSNRDDQLSVTDSPLTFQSNESGVYTGTLDLLVHTMRKIPVEETRMMIEEYPLIPARRRIIITGISQDQVESIALVARNAVTGDELVVDKNDELNGDQVPVPYRPDSVGMFQERQKIFEYVGGNSFVLRKGSYQMTKTLVIPQDLQIRINPGVVMEFAPGISLLSYSPMSVGEVGASQVRFTRMNPDTHWGVVGIIGPFEEWSHFKNVVVEYGSEASEEGIMFTGALASHGANLEVRNSLFQFNEGDDALNVKRADSLIEDNVLQQNSFDGVDIDFAGGKIVRNSIHENGNDGVDLGSAFSLVYNNRIEKNGDKGVSCGETSAPVIYNNLISENVIGIAIKDSCSSTINYNSIRKNQTGLAAYVKKPFFESRPNTIRENWVTDNLEDLNNVDGSFPNEEQFGYMPGRIYDPDSSSMR